MKQRYFEVLVVGMMLVGIDMSLADDKVFAHVPTTVSPMAQAVLKSRVPSEEQIESIEQWSKVRAEFNAQSKQMNEQVKSELVSSSHHEQIAGASVLVTTPKGYDKSRDHQIAIYIHGGAYTLGKPDYLYSAFAPLSSKLGIKVYAIDYRLAPEHPFPAGLEDTVAVYEKLLSRFGAEHIVMFGDSAGGALSLATLLKAREKGMKMPSALLLYSPWSDIDKIGDSYYTLKGISPLLDYEKNLKSSAKAYSKGHDMKNPLISPVYANYTDEFPPTMIQVGTRDMFLSNCVRLYRQMKKDKVAVEISMWEGMWHVFEAVPNLPEADEAIAEAAEFMGRYLK